MNSRRMLGEVFSPLLVVFLTTWPLWLLLGFIFSMKFGFRLLERRRLAASGIVEIDLMDGRTFEKYLEVLFRKLGYQVELTRARGDYGADLVVFQAGVKTVIQAKRHKRSVGVKAVQEAVAAKGIYGCQAAMVVTNSTYTQQATVLAKANEVTLWDRQRLVTALLSVRPEVPDGAIMVTNAPTTTTPSFQEAIATRAAPEPASDHCATCSKVVSERVRVYCVAHTERFLGQVLCYDHQRHYPPVAD